MAVDTPACIAIIGAGPTGLEAGLYARFLGYDVDIYERGRVCESLLQWSHVRLFSPAEMNCSPLGMAALAAQDSAFKEPDLASLTTAGDWIETYFLPLAETDLLVDSIHQQTSVVAIGRWGLLKGEAIGAADRRDAPFRILVRTADGQESTHTADVVIDASGTYGNHNWLGDGGIPAVGETASATHVEYGLPDVLGRDREHYAGQHVLVVGAGYSAATNTVALAKLAREAPGTRVTWITRRDEQAGPASPIPTIADDRLPERDKLATEANRLAVEGDIVGHLPGTTVAAIGEPDAQGGFEVELVGRHASTLAVDRVIANVGYRPDRRIYEELQVHECYASGGPMKLAASLLDQTSADCLDQTSGGAETLRNPEPDFYILGAKSYGRNSRYLMSIGRDQIRDLFAVLGDRAGIDLYRTINKSTA